MWRRRTRRRRQPQLWDILTERRKMSRRPGRGTAGLTEAGSRRLPVLGGGNGAHHCQGEQEQRAVALLCFSPVGGGCGCCALILPRIFFPFGSFSFVRSCDIHGKVGQKTSGRYCYWYRYVMSALTLTSAQAWKTQNGTKNKREKQAETAK